MSLTSISRYNWNTARVGVKHQPINHSIFNNLPDILLFKEDLIIHTCPSVDDIQVTEISHFSPLKENFVLRPGVIDHFENYP